MEKRPRDETGDFQHSSFLPRRAMFARAARSRNAALVCRPRAIDKLLGTTRVSRMLRDGAQAATWDALVKLGSKPCLLATAAEDLFYLRNEFRRSREIPFTRE